MQRWDHRDIARTRQAQGAFDPAGLFIGDASYLFVPNNPAYEDSVRLLFDPQGRPLEAAALAALTPQQAARCQWRRCYKLVSPLHTDRQGSFCYRVAVHLLPGSASECPVLYACSPLTLFCGRDNHTYPSAGRDGWGKSAWIFLYALGEDLGNVRFCFLSQLG